VDACVREQERERCTPRACADNTDRFSHRHGL
jgi:hypothetical protein